MNNLLWLLEPLKKLSKAKFYITKLVKEELVDTPLNKTKKFKFEALQVLHYIENGTLEVIFRDYKKKNKWISEWFGFVKQKNNFSSAQEI